MATIRARREKMDDSGLSARQTMAHLYIAYSILFGIAFSSVSIRWLFFSFVYCLSALTIFSVPCLILVLSRAQDFVLKSLFVMILGASFYALVACGLLKKKRIASVAAVTLSLLTIFTDISFCYILGFRDLAVSAVFVTGIVFNIFLVWIFQDMLRRR